MLLSLFIVLMLVVSFKTGYYYGFIRSIVRMTGRFVVLLFATILTLPVSTWLATTLFNEPSANFLFKTITFGVLMTFGSSIWHRIERVMRIFNKIPLIGFFNRLTGALVYVALSYMMMYVLLLVTRDWAIDWYQIQLQHSSVAQWMLSQTSMYTTGLTEWLVMQSGRIR